MSDKVGKVFFDDRDKDQISEDTWRIVDTEVRNFTDQSFTRAKTLLQKHEKELHILANALLEHETLTLAEIKLVLAGKPLPAKPKAIAVEKADAVVVPAIATAVNKVLNNLPPTEVDKKTDNKIVSTNTSVDTHIQK